MKHTQEEILKALQIIKDECNGSCKGCPFHDNLDECRIVETRPKFWDIKERPETSWKAFNEV
jgi:hypothetical protein